MFMKQGMKTSTEQGSALVYILIAIALLAALTVSFMEPSSQQSQGQNTFKMVSEINSQAELIRTSIQECVLVYPGGDSTAIGTGDQKNQPYPLRPSDAFFDAQCGAGESAADDTIGGIRCPGNPGNDACHLDIFGGTSGKFVPPRPSLFSSDWQYYAGDDGVFIWIETNKSDPYIQTALDKLDASYATCETDIIDASAAQEDMDSEVADYAVCPAGSKCFRLWLITKATAVYPDEIGCP